MPRIRTIKPEFWTDEKVMGISIPSRLLFIGLWNWADDNGVVENKKMQIKARIFPCDEINVGELIGELVSSGLVQQYESGGGDYLLISNLSKHQVIDKPRKSNLPLPGNQPISMNVNGNQLKSVEIMPLKEGKGMEGKGKEETRGASRAEKLKHEIELLQKRFEAAWLNDLDFIRTKYPAHDLNLILASILDWVKREPTKARKSAAGDLHLFFQRWLNREKPQYKPRGVQATIVTNDDLIASAAERKKNRLRELPDKISQQKELLGYYEEAMKGSGLDEPSIRKMKELPEHIKNLEDEFAELQGGK